MFVISLSETSLHPLFSILLYHPDLSKNQINSSEINYNQSKAITDCILQVRAHCFLIQAPPNSCFGIKGVVKILDASFYLWCYLFRKLLMLIERDGGEK